MRKIFSFIVVLIITVSFCSSLVAFALQTTLNENTSSDTSSSETTSSDPESSDPASSDPASSDPASSTTSSEPTNNPSVFVRISSNITKVKQGGTFKVTVSLELTDFNASQGINYFDNLNISFNSASFTVEKIQPVAITSNDINKSNNIITLSYNKARNPSNMLTANNIKLCEITMRANIDTAAAISQITVSQTQFYDKDNTSINSSYSSSIIMQVIEADSTNTFLKQLTVNEAELSPVFDKNTFSYNVTVPYDVTRINVTAIPEDSDAKVHITGTSDLQVGSNTVTIAVTAVSGDVKSYLIYVTRSSEASSSNPNSSSSSDLNQDEISSFINEQVSIATASREAELIQYYTALVKSRNVVYISVIVVLLLILLGEFALLILIKFDIIKLKKPKDPISKIEEINQKN